MIPDYLLTVRYTASSLGTDVGAGSATMGGIVSGVSILTYILRRGVVERPHVGVMPVGVYGNHSTLGGIARNALLGAGRDRGKSDAKSKRSEADREFETHSFLSL